MEAHASAGPSAEGAPGRSQARLLDALRRVDARLPISFKVALPAVAIGIAGAAILGLTVYRFASHDIRADTESQARLVAHNVHSAAMAQQSTAETYADSTAGLQRQIDALMQVEPSILRIDVYHLEGNALQVVASSDHGRVGTLDTNPVDVADEVAAGQKSTVLVHDDSIGSTPALHVSVGVASPAGPSSVIAVHLSAVERGEELASLVRQFALGIGGSGALAAAALGAAIYLLVIRRARRLLQATERLQAGDFSVRIPNVPHGRSRDELLELSHRLNHTVVAIQGLHEQLAAAATTDQLTGLYNRRHIMEALDREIARARRDREPLAVIMADLDGLKQVNDRLGHVAGDAAICLASQGIKAALRAGDYAARIGGDEFVAVLPGCGHDELRTVIERLQSTATDHVSAAGGPGQPDVTVSSGGAVLRLDDIAGTLLQRADDAMYEAKRAGKNQSRIAA